MTFKRICNRVIDALDPEISAIGKIIGSAAPSDAVARECDEVFVRRLLENPRALKLSFWEDHFEWRSLRDYPEIEGRILDFGCGSGHSDIFLARNGYTVHGVDLSPVGIRIASHLRRRESREVRDRLHFRAADVTAALPDTALYDAVWSSHVFEHIADPGPVLRGLRDWANPSAHLLVSVPYADAYDDPGHVNRFYSCRELANYLEGHVTVLKTELCTRFQVIRALCRFGEV